MGLAEVHIILEPHFKHLSSERVDGLVAGHGEEQGLHVAVYVERLAVVPEFHERVLHDVLGHRPVFGLGDDEAVEAVGVEVVEVGEGLVRPLFEGFYG